MGCRFLPCHWAKRASIFSGSSRFLAQAGVRRLHADDAATMAIHQIVLVIAHACWYEFFDRNPIHLVRPGSKRRKPPAALAPAEIKGLLDHLAMRERTLVFLAASTGLRQREFFGLKWSDVDFELEIMSVTRSIVYGFGEPRKTESSQKPVPLHPQVAEVLREWKKKSWYRKPDDWICTSSRQRRRKPRCGAGILRKHIQPAAGEASIEKRLGWHTLRHTIRPFCEVSVPSLRLCRSSPPLIITIDDGHIHIGDDARRACGSGSGDVTGAERVNSRYETGSDHGQVRPQGPDIKRTHYCVPFARSLDFLLLH